MRKTIVILTALVLTVVTILQASGRGFFRAEKGQKYQNLISKALAENVPENLTNDEFTFWVEDTVSEAVRENLRGEDFTVDVDARLVSAEYLKSFGANSKENIYFGYTDSQLIELFGTDMVVFRLDENGKTAVEPYEAYKNPYLPALKDLAIGSSVLIVCVAVTLATGGGAAPVAHAIFAAAAKGGAIAALSGGLMEGVTSSVITIVETGDPDQARDAFINSGAQGFKIGAIVGATTSGIGKAIAIKKQGIPTWRESELAAKKQFGGEEQVSFQNGEKVARRELNSTRPDLVRQLKDGSIEAIEVKNYSLDDPMRCKSMLYDIKREVTDRTIHLPDGYTQRIVLDTRNRNYSRELVNQTIQQIKDICSPVYKDIPVSLLNY